MRTRLLRPVLAGTAGLFLSAVLALGLGSCGGAGGGGGSPQACTTAANCTGGQVCDPATGTCAGSLACTGQAACGKGAYCATGDTCAPSVSGNACSSDDNCVGGETCSGNFCGCGGQAYTATKVEPNMVILLDRSGSMGWVPGQNNVYPGPGEQSRWDIAKAAVSNVLDQFGNQIRFGLALYSGSNLGSCDAASYQLTCNGGHSANTNPGRLYVSPADGSASTISGDLDSASVCGNTPIGATLEVLQNTQGLWATDRPNYVLLVTDGEENCGGDPAAVATALRTQNPSVKTFVIGFSTGEGVSTLTDIARAGSGDATTNYTSATDLDSLKAAFSNIAGSVLLGCDYNLGTAPPDPTRLNVWVKSSSASAPSAVPYDTTHANGWDYVGTGNTQVRIYGPNCAGLQDGSITDLSIVYGCATYSPR